MNKLKQLWNWIDDRSGISEFIGPLARHPVPPGSTWWYVFGSATLFAFILQIITGVALALIYQPTTETAYESLRYITYQMPLGAVLRGVHFWGASAMILLVGIHMIRVYLMAAFKYPREMSWITGSFLLILTVAMGFTGQLLRWDDNGVWSAIVGAQQAGRIPFIGTQLAHFLMGGETLGGVTLSRFFAFHVFLIPAFIFLFIGIHIYLVIRNGISEPPKAGQPVDPGTYRAKYREMLHREGVPFYPDAAWRDMAFGILVVLAVLALGVFSGPPEIGKPPDPSSIHANPRPDWYLLWVFALFALMPRKIESLAIAFAPLIIGLIMVLMPVFSNKGERSALRRPWAILIVVIMVTVVGSFWVAGIRASWSPDFSARPLAPAVIGRVDSAAQAGARLFSAKACIYCHRIAGDGGLRGPDLTFVADRLTPDDITLKIVNGGGNMPAFGAVLTRTELNELGAFLMTRKHPPRR
ncbi:MAG TPA: cytochrome b N-terminal domain-containing protein [Bacteroidales bacterium]|nr:cytochrome b N-terminal domain-containing protein [Bacteroidales bacterium]